MQLSPQETLWDSTSPQRHTQRAQKSPEGGLMGQRPANAPYVFTTQGVFQHQPFSNWGSHLGLVTMRLTMKGSVAQNT